MKIFICLISPNEKLRHYFGRAKSGIIPRDALKRGPFETGRNQPTVVAWLPSTPSSSADLERFLLNRARNHDVCILFVDYVWQQYVQDISNATYIVQFEAEVASVNPQNFFFGVSARMLRAFGQLMSRFKRGDDGKLLALPLRNFRADELLEISRLCRETPLSNTLGDEIEQQLTQLRARIRPRRRSVYKTTYVVDDQGRFFVYGRELHARFATGEPHRPSCELAGLFRFGVRVDEQRHYNVSETEGDNTKIGGSFPDCHGQVHAVADRTHLNMFTNDYF